MTAARIAELLKPYMEQPLQLPESPNEESGLPLLPLEDIAQRLEPFLGLLLRWNARTNLTAIRDPELMISRHFGESLLGARVLAPFLEPAAEVLDFGSGAGFPGIPLQVALPSAHVTLAESQNKKAAFLREAVRVLALSSEVWADRVESMPAARQFSAVTLRAVDRMPAAIAAASARVKLGGVLMVLEGGGGEVPSLPAKELLATVEIPGSERSVVRLWRANVPRGT